MKDAQPKERQSRPPMKDKKGVIAKKNIKQAGKKGGKKGGKRGPPRLEKIDFDDSQRLYTNFTISYSWFPFMYLSSFFILLEIIWPGFKNEKLQGN